jgi:hypothetical protein
MDKHDLEERYKDVADTERMRSTLSALFSEHYDCYDDIAL